jgi:hypothetical protein
MISSNTPVAPQSALQSGDTIGTAEAELLIGAASHRDAHHRRRGGFQKLKRMDRPDQDAC